MSDQPPKLPEIIGDKGPASSGGASLTQRVLLKMPDGSEASAHAKFITDVQGGSIMENGALGAVAELVSSGIAEAIGASASLFKPVMLPVGLEIKLRNDRRPAPGLAIAAPTVKDAVDAIDGMANDVDPIELAKLVVLHSLTQVGDHSGAANHIRAGDPPRIYSVDHASAFPAERGGGTGLASLSVTSLVAARLNDNPEALRSVARELRKTLSDERIEKIIASVPRPLLPTDESRRNWGEGLRQRRDALVGIIDPGAEKK